MRRWQIVAVAVTLTAGAATAADPPAGFPAFKTDEIDAGLAIGYGVLLEDMNGDKKPDIVVVDKHRVVWYENPTWKKRAGPNTPRLQPLPIGNALPQENS